MEDAPAIVIFGAAVRADGTPSTALLRRVEAAARFGRSLADPLYVPTGGLGRFGPAEAEVMAALLRARGVDPSSILPEDTATDTLSSVRAVRRLLRARGHRGDVYAATSGYHLPRCVVLLRMAGLRAYPCPPPPFPASRSFRKRWRWRLRECAALPVDAVAVAALRVSGRL